MYALGISHLAAITLEEGRYTEGTWGGWYPASGDQISPEPLREGEALERGRAQLHAMLEALPDNKSRGAPLSTEERSRLIALGYVSGKGIEQAAEVDPRDVVGLIPLSWHIERALSDGETQKAAALLQRLGAGMGQTHGVRQLQARLARAQGRPLLAIQLLQDLFQDAPSSNRALLLGGYHAELRDWREAELWFSEALALQPASAKAMAGLVRSAHAQGASGVAWQRAERFLALYPDHLDILLVRAELLLMDQRFDEAVEAAEWVVNLAPYRAASHALYGTALWNVGRSDDAVVALYDALALDPNHLGFRIQYVDALLDMGRNAEAVRAVEQVAGHLAGWPVVEDRLARSRAALDRERATRDL
jgi:tetratricopeptide (TPR) repeat protein